MPSPATTQEARTYHIPPQVATQLRGQTIFLIGEYLRLQLAELVRVFLDQGEVAQVVLLTESDETAQEMLGALKGASLSGRLRALATYGALEHGIERARTIFGEPFVVVCTPFLPFPRHIQHVADEERPALDVCDIAEVVTQQIAHHTRVAQQLALGNNAHLVVVRPKLDGWMPQLVAGLAEGMRAVLSALAMAGNRGVRVEHVDLSCGCDDRHVEDDVANEAALRQFVLAVVEASVRAARTDRVERGPALAFSLR